MSWKGGALHPVGEELTPDVSPALYKAKTAMRPAEPGEFAKWFGELWLVTGHEAASENEFRIKLASYSRRLSDYPADIVHHVFENWPRQKKNGEWFPKLGALVVEIEKQTQARLKLVGALEQWGTPADIRKRISLIEFDLWRAGTGNAPSDVPELAGRHGAKLQEALRLYRPKAEAKIEKLKTRLRELEA